MKIYGKNCRYAFHIENKDTSSNGKTTEIENCFVQYDGHPDYSGSYGDTFGTGIGDGQKWIIRNTHIQGSFAMHVPLFLFNVAAKVEFINCLVSGSIKLHNYQYENNVFVSFVGCKFLSAVGTLNYPYYPGNSNAIHADYTRIFTSGDLEALYYPSTPDGLALRVVSTSQGETSIVSFDKDSDAFNLIVGDSSLEAASLTTYMWNTRYGMVYRNGGANISGQAFGTLDVSTSGKSLGKRLGDCSGTSKHLGITVDGTDYDVEFNTDLSNATNSDVLAIINAVLGNNAVADLFCPAQLYYPEINGLKRISCDDANSILRGMGVVFTPSGMRRAKNSDGYIDGLCLDDTASGQQGRVITKGFMFAYRYRASSPARFFTTIDNWTSNTDPSSLGISATNDGEFDKNATPKVLRMAAYSSSTLWKII